MYSSSHVFVAQLIIDAYDCAHPAEEAKWAVARNRLCSLISFLFFMLETINDIRPRWSGLSDAFKIILTWDILGFKTQKAKRTVYPLTTLVLIAAPFQNRSQFYGSWVDLESK